MRIVLDARNSNATMSGLKRYAMNLIQNLAALDQTHEYIVLKRPEAGPPFVDQDNFRELYLRHDVASLRNSLQATQEINDLHADIFHSLCHFYPANLKATKRVVTYHDLFWLDQPGFCFASPIQAFFVQRYAQFFMPRALNASDAIIAISQTTKDAMLARWPSLLKNKAISVIHHGAEVNAPKTTDAFSTLGLDHESYVFALGNSRPNKNFPRLMEAFGLLLNDRPQLKLVIAGRGDQLKLLQRTADALGIGPAVKLFVSPEDATVRSLFEHALCFAFPTLAEGFGIPLIEAMALNCPTLTSNRAPMTEIGGSAPIYVDPENVRAIADGLLAFATDEALRAKHRKRGQTQVATFSWTQAAKDTLAIYEKLGTSKACSQAQPTAAI